MKYPYGTGSEKERETASASALYNQFHILTMLNFIGFYIKVILDSPQIIMF